MILTSNTLIKYYTIGKILDSSHFTETEITEFYKKIMENVKSIRKEKGVSQLDLAHYIGHQSVSTIGKIESGLENKHYNLEHLYKIATVLNVPISDFFKDI
jgi:DNA-binding XRE family transcriptional regulator